MGFSHICTRLLLRIGRFPQRREIGRVWTTRERSWKQVAGSSGRDGRQDDRLARRIAERFHADSLRCLERKQGRCSKNFPRVTAWESFPISTATSNSFVRR